MRLVRMLPGSARNWKQFISRKALMIALNTYRAASQDSKRKIAMQKNSISQSGLFNPRVLVAFTLCSVGVLLAMLSFAANPPGGMTGSSGNSPGDSFFADKHAGPFTGKAAAGVASRPLAPTGPGWSLVTSPDTSATQDNNLQGVTCASASDCWAVGSYNAGSAFPSQYQTL